MDQPNDASISGLPSHIVGALPVDRVERRATFLHIVADGIDDPRGLIHCPGNRRFVPYVGAHQLDLTVAREPFDKGCALRVAHRHADVGSLGGQALHDLAAEESRSSEYGYTFGRHQVSPPGIEA